MKTRGVAVVLSFLLAFAAAGAVFLYLRGANDTKTEAAVTTVIVSKQDIPAGTQLDSLISGGAFTTLSIPADAVVEGSVTALQQLQGRTTNSIILKGEQISSARLQGTQQSQATNRLGIPEGYQAVTISLESQRVLAGQIQQGDHVVVYATIQAPSAGGTQNASLLETATVVPDVQVLQIDLPTVQQNTTNRTDGSSFITLALTPKDAAKVILAQEDGHVWLSLLAPNEQGRPQSPVTIAQLVK